MFSTVCESWFVIPWELAGIPHKSCSHRNLLDSSRIQLGLLVCLSIYEAESHMRRIVSNSSNNAEVIELFELSLPPRLMLVI